MPPPPSYPSAHSRARPPSPKSGHSPHPPRSLPAPLSHGPRWPVPLGMSGLARALSFAPDGVVAPPQLVSAYHMEHHGLFMSEGAFQELKRLGASESLGAMFVHPPVAVMDPFSFGDKRHALRLLRTPVLDLSRRDILVLDDGARLDGTGLTPETFRTRLLQRLTKPQRCHVAVYVHERGWCVCMRGRQVRRALPQAQTDGSRAPSVLGRCGRGLRRLFLVQRAVWRCAVASIWRRAALHGRSGAHSPSGPVELHVRVRRVRHGVRR